MGKASRRQRSSSSTPKVVPAPFVARPFEGLPGETDWVAMREIVPAATATVRVDAAHPAFAGLEVPESVTIATVLPLAWPGLHRADGEHVVALQSGAATGDASRDVANVLLAVLASPAGAPTANVPQATAATPRLQDLLAADSGFEVTVHDSFDFWVGDGAASLDEEGRASLERANASIIPTRRLAAAPSAYWCRVGDRTHLRWILPHDEDAATNALARLHASGGDSLGEGTRLLGAFRASGLLAPVWDLDPAAEADAYEEPVAALAQRFDAALAQDAPLSAEERRAKAGLLSRQLTLR